MIAHTVKEAQYRPVKLPSPVVWHKAENRVCEYPWPGLKRASPPTLWRPSGTGVWFGAYAQQQDTLVQWHTAHAKGCSGFPHRVWILDKARPRGQSTRTVDVTRTKRIGGKTVSLFKRWPDMMTSTNTSLDY